MDKFFVKYSPEASEYVVCLVEFILERSELANIELAQRVLDTIKLIISQLVIFPYNYRKVNPYNSYFKRSYHSFW